MKSAEKAFDQQISLWPLVGPFLLLASLSLLFWNVPERALVFGFIAAFSLALSWQWTWKGVALSLGLLALGFWYHAGGMDFKETLWHLGMSAALTLGFAVTALSREETAERLLHLFPEPSVKQEELDKLHKQLAEQISSVKSLEEQVQANREAFAQQRDRIFSLEQLLNAAREEIKKAQEEREQLQRESLQRKESAARSLEQMAEAKEEARFLAEELKAQKAGEASALSELRTLLGQRDQQLKLLQADLEKIQQDIRSSKAQAEGHARRAAFLEEEKQAMLRTWERERAEAQQKAEAGLAQIKNQLAAAEEQGRRANALEEEKQAMLRTWERERAEAQQKAEAGLAQYKSQLAAAEEKGRRASALEEEKQKRWDLESKEMQDQLKSLQEKLVEAEERLNKAAHEKSKVLAVLESECSKLREALAETEARAILSEKDRSSVQRQLEALQQRCAHAEQRVADEKESAQQLRVQVELLQQNMAVAEAQKIAYWRAMRAAEGKHQQLREQFEEKSSQLNEARRERFNAEQAKESLALEIEELADYGRLVPEKPILKHIARMEREHAASLAALDCEIESLQGLIHHLFKQNS